MSESNTASLRSTSDALAVKLAAFEHFLTMAQVASDSDDNVWARLFPDFQGEDGFGGWEDRRNVSWDLAGVAEAPLYFWKRHTIDLVTAAADSYPLAPPLYIPQLPHSMCVFEKPVVFQTWNNDPVQGLVWWPYDKEAGQQGAIKVWGIGLRSPIGWVTFTEEDYKTGRLANGDRQHVFRWICAASMFVEQRICEGVEAEQPYRQLRKSAARQSLSSHVTTIQLRRISRGTPGESADPESRIEYSCQWLVRGHWRNQWYGKAQRHVARWIAPYPKGPEGKPFKAPRPSVFMVAR